MCKIKKGRQITEMCDVQNLVTASIFRSANPYNIQTLTQEIRISCDGAQIPILGEQILEMVEDTTTAFLRTGFIPVGARGYFAEYLEED